MENIEGVVRVPHTRACNRRRFLEMPESLAQLPHTISEMAAEITAKTYTNRKGEQRMTINMSREFAEQVADESPVAVPDLLDAIRNVAFNFRLATEDDE